jgi:SOS-response transcriptional repressor LexA
MATNNDNPTDPKAEKKYGLSLLNELRWEVEGFARDTGTDMAKVARQSLELYIRNHLPVLGRIPCGPLAEAIAETKESEMVPAIMRPQRNLGDYLLEAEGDSMAPKIEPGDLVMLRPGIQPAAGEICAVQIVSDDGGIYEATLKCYYTEDQRRTVVLKAINPEYPDQSFPYERVQVIGVYRGLIKKNR